ncbi:16S rRNA (cytosine(1407)-C(5))-methyltransferase RsmF [Pseudoalteromonas sp. NBT06-2]|uniref:16S rRNA (cytosine(1407)-C(5))-methyltransferase RsmF n=1 Tax=Pseudoalteromonas sp. NBT06-2 TaxID=2025950 RepID=UPI000BA6C0F1|nr:16S rRNA (cytosine(1407)-C(5))-methyltransferase RsmF [Pseudoalteromonas sp. NBT06-2]PAJ74213.1 16S rRNA (cytosine(1407)-C(5))-methyltransferase RsmF [Pseudoalteromonas sp. NBT06-2]
MNQNTYIPQAFIDDVKSYIPDHLCINDYINTCKQPLRRSIRVNTLKMSVEEFKKIAKSKNWDLDPVPWCKEGFWLKRPEDEENNLSIGNTDLHLSGAMYVQEASSMLPPTALLKNNVFGGNIVLDMASAPGSKTSQIAGYMQGQGILVANELSSSRLKVLSANMKRLGVSNVALSHFDAAVFGAYMSECFDSILLDAPCSGEGTVRKDADALKNWSLESNIEIANVQKKLIESAFYALKTGGTLVYSTCTLTPIENQAVCEHVLSLFKGMIEVVSLNDLFDGAKNATTPEGYLHIWPQTFDCEGFFIAKFKKIAHKNPKEIKIKKGDFPFTTFDNKSKQGFYSLINKQFGIKSLPGTLMQRDKELWLFPQEFSEISNKIKYSRIGINIGTLHKNGIRLNHEFATCFGDLTTKNRFELSDSQANEYFGGKDIKLAQSSSDKGELLLTLCGTGVGLGKWMKHKIKNSLPRDLVRDNQLITWGKPYK